MRAPHPAHDLTAPLPLLLLLFAVVDGVDGTGAEGGVPAVVADILPVFPVLPAPKMALKVTLSVVDVVVAEEGPDAPAGRTPEAGDVVVVGDGASAEGSGTIGCWGSTTWFPVGMSLPFTMELPVVLPVRQKRRNGSDYNATQLVMSSSNFLVFCNRTCVMFL